MERTAATKKVELRSPDIKVRVCAENDLEYIVDGLNAQGKEQGHLN